MRVVLDASAAVRVARQSEGYEPFEAFLHKADSIETPEIFIAETSNAMWKYFKAGYLSRQSAEDSLEAALRLVDEIIPMRPLVREAFSLAATGQRSTYDMFYLALARRNDAVLLTADQGLARFAESHDVKTFSPKI